MMKRLLLVALVLPALGCGSDATGPKQANLDGTWRFSYSNMAGAVQGVTVSCNVGPVDFSVTQTGNTFSAVQVGTGNLSCSAPGAPTFSEQLAGETIVSGQIQGSAVTFRLGSVSGQHVGTVTGTSMTGTAQWTFPLDDGSLTLNGQFTAAKLN